MKSSSKTVCSALNRLAVACLDEEAALLADASTIEGERGKRLRVQALRREVFRSDLAAGVVALGGAPARVGSYGMTLSAALRSVRKFFVGARRGDAYARSARAAERTARAYSTVLDLELPSDVHFGLERQYVEIEFDRRELRWLRWGGSLGLLPAPGGQGNPARPMPSAGAREAENELALAVWRDDGGRSERCRA
jgi:hypothetical protein